MKDPQNKIPKDYPKWYKYFHFGKQRKNDFYVKKWSSFY